jgi:hypothetical protein
MLLTYKYNSFLIVNLKPAEKKAVLIPKVGSIVIAMIEASAISKLVF